jgi:hypothetical protein
MNDHYPDKINLDDLYNRKHEIEDLRIKIYKKLLNRAHQKIKFTSRQRNSESFCFFIVPEFLVGTPKYDSAACIAFIMDKLIENGFQVKYTHPNLLFISWRHYIPKYERANIKKQYGVAVDGFGNKLPDKKTVTNNDKPKNMNDLIFNRPTKNSIVKKQGQNNKNYTQISEYKPTGNLIYNTALLKNIENNTNN